MNKTSRNIKKEKQVIDYLNNAIQKIQGVTQDLFDKQNQNQIDNLEFYFYCIGNDIYYNLHRYENIFSDRLDLLNLWYKRYEDLHDSIETVCPILKETGKIPAIKFEIINQEIYRFLITSREIENLMSKKERNYLNIQ